jgi:CRISPR/Cas system CMR subunit Cmr4 (Cas7 group RAMP superfamily)
MTMSATATMNGRPQRKQLSDQLDRLDTIIDALAEALPSAVADACKEGARAAVKDAIVEIMTNAEFHSLIGKIRPETASTVATSVPEQTPLPQKLNHWHRFKAKIAAARDAVCSAATRVREAIVGRCNAARDTVVAVGTAAGEMIPVKRILLTGLGVGLVVGVACLVMPQTVAAGVSALTATCTSIAMQTGNWLKRVSRRFCLVT